MSLGKKSVHSVDQIHEEPEVDGARCQELGANLAERQHTRQLSRATPACSSA